MLEAHAVPTSTKSATEMLGQLHNSKIVERTLALTAENYTPNHMVIVNRAVIFILHTKLRTCATVLRIKVRTHRTRDVIRAQ
jgi:hypothetical protein